MLRSRPWDWLGLLMGVAGGVALIAAFFVGPYVDAKALAVLALVLIWCGELVASPIERDRLLLWVWAGGWGVIALYAARSRMEALVFIAPLCVAYGFLVQRRLRATAPPPAPAGDLIPPPAPPGGP